MDARSSSARRTNPFKARSRTSDRSFCEPPGFTWTQNLRADCVLPAFQPAFFGPFIWHRPRKGAAHAQH
jgi:hypothetical protein